MKRIRGITFLEVLISAVIASIVLSAMLSVLNFANRYTRHNANKTMALNFAQALVEEIRNKEYEDPYATTPNYHAGAYTNYLGPELNIVDVDEQDDDLNEDNSVDVSEFDDVDDYNGYTDTVYLYEKEDVSIPATRTVEIKDQNGNATLDSEGYEDVTYKHITVTVAWDCLGRHFEEKVDTIRCSY